MNQSLMSYISSNPTQGARKYTGSVATGYDAKRTESPKWAAEQEIIERIIEEFDGGSVLDVPVGTGRFIPAYERNNLNWVGIDLSDDMLHEAAAKVTSNTKPQLFVGDVTRLDSLLQPKGVDHSIMCRLTRWLTPTQRVFALKQLQAVTAKSIVFTARIANHPYAYPIEAIEAAIEPGWRIAENIEAGEPEYRVFVLERE